MSSLHGLANLLSSLANNLSESASLSRFDPLFLLFNCASSNSKDSASLLSEFGLISLRRLPNDCFSRDTNNTGVTTVRSLSVGVRRGPPVTRGLLGGLFGVRVGPLPMGTCCRYGW